MSTGNYTDQTAEGCDLNANIHIMVLRCYRSWRISQHELNKGSCLHDRRSMNRPPRMAIDGSNAGSWSVMKEPRLFY